MGRGRHLVGSWSPEPTGEPVRNSGSGEGKWGDSTMLVAAQRRELIPTSETTFPENERIEKTLLLLRVAIIDL